MLGTVILLAIAGLQDNEVPDLGEKFGEETAGVGKQIKSDPRPYDGPSVQNPNERFQGSERLEMSISFEFVPVADGPMSGEVVAETVCLNACQGPPPDHATHKECDRLCDRPCEREHDMSVSNGPLEQDQEGINELGKSVRDLVKASNNRGMPMAMDGFAVLDAISQPFDFVRNNSAPIEIKNGHLTPDGVYQPCHQTTLKYKSLQYDIRATVEVRFVLFTGPASAPTYAEYRSFANKGPITIGRVRGVNPNPTGEGTTVCACEKTGDLGLLEDPAIKVGDDFVIIPTDAEPKEIKDLFVKTGLDLNVFGQNLNYGAIDLTGDQPVELYLPPGTFLMSEDPQTQSGMTYADVGINFSFLASLNPSFAAPTRFRFACLEINKKQPTPATKFIPMPARDPVLVLLAKQGSASRFQGPWDQARVWIYTDEATYEKIGEVLKPNISRGTYLQCLREVAVLAPRRRNGSSWGTLISPATLLDANGDRASMQWGAAQIQGEAVKDLLKFAKEAPRPSEFDEDWVNTCRVLISEFGMRKDAESQELTRVIAERWVPAGVRAEFGRLNGFDGLMWMALQRETANGTWARTFLNAHAPETAAVVEEILAESKQAS